MYISIANDIPYVYNLILLICGTYFYRHLIVLFLFQGDVAEINTQVLGLNTDLLNLLATSVTLNETMNVFESYQPQVVSLINGEIMSQSSREFVKAFDLTTASIRDGAILKVSDPDIVLTYIDSLMGYPRESPNVLTGTDEVLAFVLEYQEFYNPSISRLDLNGVWEVDIKTGLPLVDYTLQRTAVHDSQRVDSFGGASIYFSASLGPTGVTSQYSIIEATIRNDLMYVTNSTPA